jgi:hypothetical protein
MTNNEEPFRHRGLPIEPSGVDNPRIAGPRAVAKTSRFLIIGRIGISSLINFMTGRLTQRMI